LLLKNRFRNSETIMENEFYPPRRLGLIIHGVILLVLVLGGGYFFYLSAQDPSGVGFLLNMLIALAFLAPLPVLLYRLYALVNAVYILRRSGLMIRWGLRREDIPISHIDWIRPAAELGFHLPLPWLRLPGSIIGFRRLPELGRVEFMASDVAHLVLVATSDKVYAISPRQNNQFMRVFREVNEMGSLAPIDAQSVYPRLFISRVWEDRVARILILTGFGVGLVVLGVAALSVPSLENIDWLVQGATAPAERLLLLPVLNGFIWLVNLLFGTFLYRRGADFRIAAYLLWGSAVLVGALLLLGSLIIIY
jgi:hypothetical protein